MSRHSGFTLLEVAIVLVIVGLTLVGISTGRELISNAKTKSLASDFRDVPNFVYGYMDKYRALPGDDSRAGIHLGGSAPHGNGNGLIDGMWNTTKFTESAVFWQHVRLASLANGPTVAGDLNGDQDVPPDFLPRNVDGGIIGIQSNASPHYVAGLRGTYLVCSAGVKGRFVRQLDIAMDDGCTSTGAMMAVAGTPTGANNAPVALATSGPVCSGPAVLNEDAAYTVCMGF